MLLCAFHRCVFFFFIFFVCKFLFYAYFRILRHFSVFVCKMSLNDYTPEKLTELKGKVYNAARDGMAISVFTMLRNIDRHIVNVILGNYTEEDGELTTPFIIAARKGREEVIRIFLSNFNVNFEQCGTVKLDGNVIHGATALWCAAAAGHIGVVKLLIQNGADPSHFTTTNSTPLRAACFDAQIGTVCSLVRTSANLSIKGAHKYTCLMMSCYKGYGDVVSYLLQSNADPNYKASCGSTALHFASEYGHLDIVKELIKYKAIVVRNNHCMTPLFLAAESGKEYVVSYLLTLPGVTTEERINAFELLGASFASNKEGYNLEKAYIYLIYAMNQRHEYNVSKCHYSSIAAYGNRQNCQCLAELEAIQHNDDALHMECLSIREHILGCDNPKLTNPIVYRGAVFADSGLYDRCVSLWMHAMYLRQRNNRPTCDDLLRLSQVLSQMVSLRVKLQFFDVFNILEHAMIELDQGRSQVSKDRDTLSEMYQVNVHSFIYLLVIAINIEKTFRDKKQLRHLVCRFLKQKPLLKNGYTPLHMSVDFATIVHDFHANDIVKFPNSNLVSLLVSCGADVDALDKQGNTPLHIIVCYSEPISDFDTLLEVILTLIQKGGAHTDICNNEQKTPLMCTTTGVAEIILRQHSHLSLMCLAAHAIRQYRVDYDCIFPDFLKTFIDWH